MSIEEGLAAAATRAARAIAAEVPRDVRVTVDGHRIALTGRGLVERSLLDPRLRDFAAVIR